MTSLPPDTPLSARKRAVIIGASTGIGAALARELVRRGYFVALLARGEADLAALTAELNTGDQTNAVYYIHDVTETGAVPGLFQTLLADLQRIDSFVYCAGVMPHFAFSEYDFEKNRAMVDVQLTGALAWFALVAPLFERMGSGQIVGISSVAAERGRVVNPGYNASKAGFDTFLEGLRNRLTRSGIHVLTVRPGPTDTRLTEEVGGLLMVAPERVARDIARAMHSRRQVLYTPWIWRWIMLIIRNIPSVVFRRMNF